MLAQLALLKYWKEKHGIRLGWLMIWLVSTPQHADTAKMAFPLSVGLVLVYYLPHLTPSRPSGALEGVQVETTVSRG